MAVFDAYARYYDLLYQDKDYQGETDFTLTCFRRAGCIPTTVLDLGCGTGRHALAMARHGICVTGADVSETMLAMGRGNFSRPNMPHPVPELLWGDARTLRLNRTFDAVTSLFHVMSYQNTEQDALAMLTTTRAHLAPGGLFLFDFWHGPGVLADPPARRQREMEDEHTRVIRSAEPEHRANDNTVVVRYHVTVADKATGRSAELQEDHSMRYWFVPELRRLAEQASFRGVQSGAWLTENPPDAGTWYAWMLLAAQ